MCRPLFRILFGFILQQNAILLEVGNLSPCMLKKYELRLRLFAHFANMPKAQIQTKYATCLLHYKLLPTASILYVCKTMNARALHTVLVTPIQIPWHLCRVEVGTAEAKVLRGSSKPNFSQKIHWHAILEPPLSAPGMSTSITCMCLSCEATLMCAVLLLVTLLVVVVARDVIGEQCLLLLGCASAKSSLGRGF